MKMITIRIPTADDSTNYLTAEIEINIKMGDSPPTPVGGSWITERTNTMDAIHDGICSRIKAFIQERYKYAYSETMMEFVISDYAIILTKDSSYKLNGQTQTLTNIVHILSRLIYASINDKDRSSIRDKFIDYCITPNDVLYAIENKVPYHWYDNGKKVDVRLNVKRIASTQLALEIGDGIWGSISMKELNSFLGFYLHGKKRTHWKFCSPAKLYENLLGREPSESDLEVMIAFLSQNRTAKIVEERAKQLLVSMSEQYADRMYMTNIVGDNDEGRIFIRVKGKNHQWLLEERHNSEHADRQKVSVYILGTEKVTEFGDIEYNMGLLDEGEHTFRERTSIKCSWRGPICIDNLASGSSLGDQFASRIFAVMNDDKTIARVSTLNHYTKNDYSMPNLSLEEGLHTDFEIKRPHSYKEYSISIANVIEEEFL